MKKVITVIILTIILSGCANKNNNVKSVETKPPVPMSMFWGLPIGITTAMSPSLASNLKDNNIDPIIHTDKNINNINFSSVVNDQVLIVSDFIAAIILKDNLNWRVVGRLNDFRVGVMVPNNSTISQFSDLKNKRICGNISLVKTLKIKSEKIGEIPENFINFSPTDDETIRQTVINAKNGNWKNCDAIIVPDALLSYFQIKKLGKIIDQDILVSVIMARNDYIQTNPEVMVDFFQAFSKTLDSFRKNMIIDKKFSVEGMPDDIASQVYHMTYDNEENFNEQALKPLRFYLNKDEIEALQQNADMTFDYVTAKPRINVNDYIDVSYAAKALERKNNQ